MGKLQGRSREQGDIWFLSAGQWPPQRRDCLLFHRLHWTHGNKNMEPNWTSRTMTVKHRRYELLFMSSVWRHQSSCWCWVRRCWHYKAACGWLFVVIIFARFPTVQLNIFRLLIAYYKILKYFTNELFYLSLKWFYDHWPMTFDFLTSK